MLAGVRQFAVQTLPHAESGLHGVIQQWGMTLPIELYFFNRGLIYAPMLKPSSWLAYLLCKKPGIVFGGFPRNNPFLGDFLTSFWEAYRYEDPDHTIFRDHSHHLSKCFPYTLFGDEGRGLRKAPVQVVALEMVFNVSTYAVFEKALRAARGRCDLQLLREVQAHTGHGNSLTSRLLLYVLPHTAYKAKLKNVWFEVLDVVIKDLAGLYTSGINVDTDTFYPILIGVKGDAPALNKMGQFTRSFNRIHGGSGICHHCLAGKGPYVWEDVTSNPNWLPTCYQERPWTAEKPSCVLPIPYSISAPEKVFRSDPMHLVKLGIGRHYVASSIVALGDLNVFNDTGASIARFLEAAHIDFTWCCKREIRQTPNLKQFTREGFHWTKRSAYPFGGCMDALVTSLKDLDRSIC